MKIITQISLFDDTQNENPGDLDRLKLVLENLPDACQKQQANESRQNSPAKKIAIQNEIKLKKKDAFTISRNLKFIHRKPGCVNSQTILHTPDFQ